MGRKVMDCRETPNAVGCTLTITGEEEEVVRAAAEHAVSVHSERDSEELRRMIRSSLRDEGAPYRPAGEHGASAGVTSTQRRH